MKTFVDDPVSTVSTVLDFVFSVLISVCGVIVNYRFRKKLKEEKRNTPPGRKGNVIEPIMSWYCILQMIFWPFRLLFLWIVFNGVITSEQMPSWLCYLLYYAMRIGRMCIAYNSLFVALIRYLYIVHRQKANQWNFERTSRWFQIASIAIPVALEALYFFAAEGIEFTTSNHRFDACLAYFDISYTTENVRQFGFELSLRVLPLPLVATLGYVYSIITIIVICNVVEVFFLHGRSRP